MYTLTVTKSCLKPMNCQAVCWCTVNRPRAFANCRCSWRAGPRASTARVRRARRLAAFAVTQDDAAAFAPEQIGDEIMACDLADTIYSVFDLNYELCLSTRPTANTIGSDEGWAAAEAGLEALARGASRTKSTPATALRTEDRLYAQRRTRPAASVRHHSARLWTAQTLRPHVHRIRRRAPRGHAASRSTVRSIGSSAFDRTLRGAFPFWRARSSSAIADHRRNQRLPTRCRINSSTRVSHRCCTPTAIRSARKVATPDLKIPTSWWQEEEADADLVARGCDGTG